MPLVTQLPSVVDRRVNLESNREPLWAGFQAEAGHRESSLRWAEVRGRWATQGRAFREPVWARGEV